MKTPRAWPVLPKDLTRREGGRVTYHLVAPEQCEIKGETERARIEQRLWDWIQQRKKLNDII